MERAQYEAIIRDTIEALPDQIREKLNDVAIVIEETAPPQKRGILLGLYEGMPLTEWGRDMVAKLPDKITLFTASIEQVAGSEERIPDIVRETLWHEIAHYFGFGHDRIHVMEERWRAKRGLQEQ
ncbi:MAG TPA: metallopeptidase family protein [Candidatus Peribacteraceae bacterium]|nr:metallopeptidase family protein [Candidatus Peribacteraceae bacterium]